jgi:PAS domain S-box-containing protein
MTPAEETAAWEADRASHRPVWSSIGWSLAEFVRSWQPPIRRREFWAVQLFVLMIAGGHLLVEMSNDSLHGALAYIPTSLFLIPVVYAALNFGLHGSLPTALWSAVISVPNVALFHEGTDQLGEIWQIGLVVAVAAFVGQRVDREKRARRDAEEREQARRASEAKYRGIFDNVVEPILLLNQAGVIENANQAAGSLFSADPAALRGRQISELMDIDLDFGAARATSDEVPVIRPLSGASAGRPAWVEPVLIPLADSEGPARIQLMLRDLTSQHERQQELEAYARQTTAAREEERGRIARELHDGPVQTLVLLWRKLDAMGTLAEPSQEAELRAAQNAALTAADELRRLSRDLRPSILHDLGLPTALRAEVASLARRSGIVARLVSVGPERRLDGDRELALLRIVQEALRNIELHAGARRATVRLHYQPARVRLVISDDGQGLLERPPSQLVADGKLGLIGMREQARLIDATITIAGGARGGTAITVTVPG